MQRLICVYVTVICAATFALCVSAGPKFPDGPRILRDIQAGKSVSRGELESLCFYSTILVHAANGIRDPDQHSINNQCARKVSEGDFTPATVREAMRTEMKMLFEEAVKF